MKKINLLLVFIFMIAGYTKAQNIRVITDTTQTNDILINEVTVKSAKELPRVKDVPASISLISARMIANDEITSLADISSKVPNFFMMDYGSKLQSPVFIRGIGSRLGSPSVGLYVDNVPYFEKKQPLASTSSISTELKYFVAHRVRCTDEIPWAKSLIYSVNRRFISKKQI